jgi:arylsulfatase
MGKPNILLIMTDQQRWDALGFVSAWMKTPNLDRIAREGVQFTNCITTSPLCVPARRALVSGLYAHNTGVWENRVTPLNTPTWMNCIRDAGYRTSLFGKMHLNPHRGDLREVAHLLQAQGLDDVNETAGPRDSTRTLSHMTAEWASRGIWDAYKRDLADRYSGKPYVARPSTLGFENYYDTYVGRKAKAYLDAFDRNQPWFCWVSFGGPHEPWDAPEPYAGAYAPEAMPEPLAGDMTGAADRARGTLDKRLENLPGVTSKDVAEMRANYAGNVTLIDDMVGEIFEVIEQRGELSNTIIALASDHGEMNGDYGLVYKRTFLESSVRIPFFIRTPTTVTEANAAGERGRVCASPVEWIDLGPTLVELAGGEIGYRQFGKSLGACLADPRVQIREECLCELAGEFMVRNAHWKVAANREEKAYLLFNLENDPNETRNLAGLSNYQGVEMALLLRIRNRVTEAQTR